MKTSPKTSGSQGFSLVEVALALGIAAFALVSILGLLNVAVGTDGDAGRDTTFASMSSHVMNELRSVPFDALWTTDPESNRDATTPSGPPADTVFYFTSEGTPASAADLSDSQKSLTVVYRCTVKKTPDTFTQSVGTATYNQLKLQLVFNWPATGTSAITDKTRTKIVYGSIARY